MKNAWEHFGIHIFSQSSWNLLWRFIVFYWYLYQVRKMVSVLNMSARRLGSFLNWLYWKIENKKEICIVPNNHEIYSEYVFLWFKFIGRVWTWSDRILGGLDTMKFSWSDMMKYNSSNFNLVIKKKHPTNISITTFMIIQITKHNEFGQLYILKYRIYSLEMT